MKVTSGLISGVLTGLGAITGVDLVIMLMALGAALYITDHKQRSRE